MSKRKLEGIHGWLLLLFILIGFGAIWNFMSLFSLEKSISEIETLHSQGTQTSETLTLLSNLESSLGLMSIFVILLFICLYFGGARKKKFIGWTIFAFVTWLLIRLTFFYSFKFGSYYIVLAQIFWTIVIIAYLKKSERVKNTFTK